MEIIDYLVFGKGQSFYWRAFAGERCIDQFFVSFAVEGELYKLELWWIWFQFLAGEAHPFRLEPHALKERASPATKLIFSWDPPVGVSDGVGGSNSALLLLERCTSLDRVVGPSVAMEGHRELTWKYLRRVPQPYPMTCTAGSVP